MKTLSIELSTDTGSVALLEGRSVVWEKPWVENRQERQGFFVLMGELVGAGTLDLATVDAFTVGVGPGSFAGLRMAVSAVCSLAMPGGKPVTGILSAEAVAHEVMGGTEADEVIVWGDARRNELWALRFGRGALWPERRSELRVDRFDRIPGDWALSNALWVTADWERIGARLKAVCPPEVVLVEKRMIPAASHVGWIGVVKREMGAATEPLLPVYVHPAVAVAPEAQGEPVVPEEKKGKTL